MPTVCAAEGKIPVEARVGVNTGEVVVRTIETGGHTEYTPVGHVTNLAARMQTAAPAGSIAASEATQRLCEGYFEFRALGPTAVKGTQRPGRGVRGGARRAAADALPARGAARADAVRRARARDGGDGRRAGAGQGGPRADRCGSWRGGRGQVAPDVRVQGHYPGRMQSAGGVLGLARQGVGLAAGDRAAARAISRSPTRTTTVAGPRRSRPKCVVSTRRSRRRCPTS